MLPRGARLRRDSTDIATPDFFSGLAVRRRRVGAENGASMTRAVPTLSGWAAWYIDRDAGWRLAGNALGRAIICETAALTISVVRSRRRRLKPLKG